MTIYLDNAASSCPKAPGVVEAVEESLRLYCANPGRGAHKKAVAASRIIFQARERTAGLLGVKDAANIIFTQNATDALNMAMRGFLSPGDHVVSSTVEHNAVARPLLALAREGIDVSLATPDSDGKLTPGKITALLTPKTKLVAISHASNVIGAIQPIADIGAELRKKGVALLVDAAQTGGAVPFDLDFIDVDMIAFTGHKSLLAPQGIGLLYISPGIELKTVRQGGTGTHSDQEQDQLPRPDRYECGTLNTPGIAGLGAAVGFIEDEGLEKMAGHKAGLTDQLHRGLIEISGVVAYGPPPGADRVSLVSFNVGGLPSSEVSGTLDREYDIASRAGLHCAPGAHRHLGTLNRGVVRLSVGAFNDETDIDAALKAVADIASGI